MNTAERQLAEQRAARDAARNAFEQRLAGVQDAIADQGIGPRIAHDIAGRARATADEAADVARESRWIIGGTIAALVVWFARRPLFRAVRSGAAKIPGEELRRSWARIRDWTIKKVRP